MKSFFFAELSAHYHTGPSERSWTIDWAQLERKSAKASDA
jgi:hypothetical protein